MNTRDEAAKEYEAAIARCRKVLAAVAGNRRKFGPISTHAQTALNHLALAERLSAANTSGKQADSC